MTRGVIIGSGAEIAPNRVTNDMMARLMDTSDAWIPRAQRGGDPYFASPDQATSDFGVAASKRALEAAGSVPRRSTS
jgi:3-oxoacyl-[acyl-carrier-protein] synthase-3